MEPHDEGLAEARSNPVPLEAGTLYRKAKGKVWSVAEHSKFIASLVSLWQWATVNRLYGDGMWETAHR